MADLTQKQCYLRRADIHFKLHQLNQKQTSLPVTTPALSRHNPRRQKSNLEMAIREYSRAIHVFPTDFLLYLYRGRMLMLDGYASCSSLSDDRKRREAMNDFKQALTLNNLNQSRSLRFVQVTKQSTRVYGSAHWC